MYRTKLRRRAAMQPKNKPTRKTRARRLELNLNKRNSRVTKPRMAISKLNPQNILDVIKCISGPAYVNAPEEKLSDESIIYVGTTYLNFLDVPRKVSTIDLTRSEDSWGNNYHGDNACDELGFKARPVSSSCSICTILPPKPSHLFDSPSDETCTCWRRLSQKRNLSLTDVTYVKSKRRVQCRSRNVPEETDRGSTEFIWKLKKSYPLSNGLCLNNANSEIMNADVQMKELVDRN